MASYRSLRDFDWTMFTLAYLICGLGVLQIYSATHDTIWRDAWWKQIVWILAASVLMWVFTLIDYHTLLAHVPSLYGISVATLIATFVVGQKVFGSRRWIGRGSIHLQVSEFVKLVLVLLVARYLSELKREQLELRDLARLGGLIGLPMILVMKQPDLGTALTYAPILLIGIFLAGLRWQHAVAIVLALAIVVPIGYYFLQDYQKARLVSFIDPKPGSEGDRLSGDPVQDRRRLGSAVGPGRYERQPDAVAVSAGAAHRFHFFRVCGRTWVRRVVVVVLALLFSAAHADRSERADRDGPGRNVYLYGRSDGFVVSRAC